MKKFGFATIIASGLTAAFLGLAGPASAGVDHLDWLNDIHQQVSVAAGEHRRTAEPLTLTDDRRGTPTGVPLFVAL